MIYTLDRIFGKLSNEKKSSSKYNSLLRLIEKFLPSHDLEVKFGFGDPDIYFSILFPKPIEKIDEKVFWGWPCDAFSCQKIHLVTNNDTIEIDKVSTKVKQEFENEILSYQGKITGLKEITLSGLFNNALPSRYQKDTPKEVVTDYIRNSTLMINKKTKDKKFKITYLQDSFEFNIGQISTTKSLFEKTFKSVENNDSVIIQIREGKDKVFYDIKSGKVEITKGMQKKLDEKLKLPKFLGYHCVLDLEAMPFVHPKSYFFTEDSISLFDSFVAWLEVGAERKKIEAAIKEAEKKLNTERVNKLEERRDAIENDTIYRINDQLTFKEPSNEQETVCMFLMLHGAKKLPFYEFIFHEYTANAGIDSVSSYKIQSDEVLKKYQATEFEFCLSNFFRHGHPIQHTQLIICWIIDRFDNIEQDNKYKWRKFLITEDNKIPIFEIRKFPIFEGSR